MTSATWFPLYQSLRIQDGFHKLFQEASNVAETFLNCNITKPRTASRSVYRAAAAATAGDTAEDYYRINVFYPAVDSILWDPNCASAQSRRCPWIWATWFQQHCQLYSMKMKVRMETAGVRNSSVFRFLNRPDACHEVRVFFCGHASGRKCLLMTDPNLLFQRWTTVANFSTWNCWSSCSQHFQSQLQKRSVRSRRWRKLQRQFAQQSKRIGSRLFYFFKYTVTWLQVTRKSSTNLQLREPVVWNLNFRIRYVYVWEILNLHTLSVSLRVT